jgi:hypothetical protein
MVKIGSYLISDDVFEEQFICDINQCKGACCVEGDLGAPLHKEEITDIEHNLKEIFPYMAEPQKTHVKEWGFWEEDHDGLAVTQCTSDGRCVFSKQDGLGILHCGIERSFQDGKSDFIKPISCHLYPIRVSQVGTYTVLNYHRWSICSPACDKGKANKMPVFRFLEKAIIRAFGQDFYDDCEAVYGAKFNQHP